MADVGRWAKDGESASRSQPHSSVKPQMRRIRRPSGAEHCTSLHTHTTFRLHRSCHTLRSSRPSSIWCLKGPRSTVRIKSLLT